MGASRKTSQNSIMLAERRARMLRMRLDGFLLEDIAEAEACSTATACREVQRALADLAEQNRTAAAELRAVQTERLERMYRGLRPGIDKGSPAAVQSGIKVVERLAKLWGIDAPERLDLTATVASRAALTRLSDEEVLALDERLNGAENRDEEPAETA